MKIIRYSDPEDFQDRVIDYLTIHEAENNLPLGILASIITGEYSGKEPYLALAEEGGEIRLVTICTPPYPVLVSYQEKVPDKDFQLTVLTYLFEHLREDFSGITGNKSFVNSLLTTWKEISNINANLKMAMRIFKLEKVFPVMEVPGQLRPITADDKELVLDWYANFIREGMGDEPDLAKVEKHILRYLKAKQLQRGLMFWEVDGTPVSMAGYAGPTPNGIRIGAVYTPPDQRKKGYASACTASLSQYLLDLGFRFCFLFTDLMNPTSNKIYQQIGYQGVCDVDRYDFIYSDKDIGQ